MSPIAPFFDFPVSVSPGAKARRWHRVALAGALVLTLGALLGTVAPPSASASTCSGCTGWWHLVYSARPTFLPPAHEENGKEVPGEGQIVLTVSNLGDAPIDGSASPIALADTLPEGLRVAPGGKSVEASVYSGAGGQGAPLECSVAKNVPSCVWEGSVGSYAQIEMIVDVLVEPGAASGEQNSATVTGGGLPPDVLTRPIAVATPGEKTPYGIDDFEVQAQEAGGAPETQAGAHPFQVTTTVVLNQSSGTFGPTGLPEALPAALAKDLYVTLPPGLVGNPTPFPQCSLSDFYQKPDSACPADTIMGVAMTTFYEPGAVGLEENAVPIYNLEPQRGEPARFGYIVVENNPVFIDTSVRSGEDYAIVAKVSHITQTAAFISSEVTFWGTPGEAAHDAFRGSSLDEAHPPAFFEMPAACNGEMHASIVGDSWSDPLPAGSLPQLAEAGLPALDGCSSLPFQPSIRVTPDVTSASSASGLTVDVHNPEEESVQPGGLGEADPRDITVALPAGVAVNPAGGNGLQDCSEGLAGFKGFQALPSQPGFETAVFSPWYPGSFTAKAAVAAGEAPGSDETLEPGLNFCANASKIGEVAIHTPLLPKPIEGFVYIATQNQNPFGSLVAMYIVAEEKESGVTVKLTGQVHLNPENGQLVTTFENSPQAPFEDAELHFFGEERAPLATPAHCGVYTTTASFTPWSAEKWDEAAVTVPSSSQFTIDSGPHETACPGASLPFSPSLTGGSTNINAGSFTPLTTTIGREDGNQNMAQVTLHFPPGLSGMLAGVRLCGEDQANEGTCGPESQIGETTVSAGVGSDPVSVTGGKVYITGPYHGAPFGLSIVNPVKAGPFDLEHDTSNPSQDPRCDCVVVRAKIEVNQENAALTIITNSESEGYAIPHIIDGIPVQIKKVNVLVNRPGFTFNPTSCDKMEIAGSIASGEEASSPVSVPLQVTNCKDLAFAPKFAVSTQGNGKANGNGASLDVKLSAKQGPQSQAAGMGEANIAKVDVSLPVALSSRLKVLQKACTEAQFAANPAGCPEASDVGTAIVQTPILPVPLTGPAYFVSHGGEAFPDLVMVLQGYGVTVDLVGHTKITGGVTYTKFETVPDAPVANFELNLPEGPHAILGAIKNLCKPTKAEAVEEKVAVKRHGRTVHVTKKVQKQVPEALIMPTEMTGQNGSLFKQETHISVNGCPKAKPAAKKANKKKPRKKR